jgi:hypothetical protein
MQIALNKHAIPITTVEEMRQQLAQIHQQQYSEVWLEIGEEGPALMMLVNGDAAWLMYLQDVQDDAGSISRNPHYTGSAEAKKEFFLSNGQRDEYPAAWTLPLEEACAACDYFVLSGGDRSSAVYWS